MLDDDRVPLLACRPVNPEQLRPDRRAVWDHAVREGQIPPMYPGRATCNMCQILVCVGPNSEQAVARFERDGRYYELLCMACVPFYLAEIEALRDEAIEVLMGKSEDLPDL